MGRLICSLTHLHPRAKQLPGAMMSLLIACILQQSKVAYEHLPIPKANAAPPADFWTHQTSECLRLPSGMPDMVAGPACSTTLTQTDTDTISFFLQCQKQGRVAGHVCSMR